MRKFLLLSMTAVVAILLSCSASQMQRQVCEEGCRTARDDCKEDAQKIRYRVKRTAKLATCDVGFDECMKKCAE